MWWSEQSRAGSPERRAPHSPAGAGDRLFCIRQTPDDEDELDRSRPVPWDWPETPRPALS